MGRIARLLGFVRTTKNGANVSDVKVNPGGGANITGEHFSAPGEDANPLPGDSVITISIEGTGREVVVGYIDHANAQTASSGEKRVYARNSSGAAVVHLFLHSDGSAELINANGGITLHVDGSVDINGATITAAGDVISATGISLNNHVHSDPQGGNTGVPI